MRRDGKPKPRRTRLQKAITEGRKAAELAQHYWDLLQERIWRQACLEDAMNAQAREIARLREVLTDWRGKINGPGVNMQTLLHRTDEALKEDEHD